VQIAQPEWWAFLNYADEVNRSGRDVSLGIVHKINISEDSSDKKFYRAMDEFYRSTLKSHQTSSGSDLFINEPVPRSDFLSWWRDNIVEIAGYSDNHALQMANPNFKEQNNEGVMTITRARLIVRNHVAYTQSEVQEAAMLLLTNTLASPEDIDTASTLVDFSEGF